MSSSTTPWFLIFCFWVFHLLTSLVDNAMVANFITRGRIQKPLHPAFGEENFPASKLSLRVFTYSLSPLRASIERLLQPLFQLQEQITELFSELQASRPYDFRIYDVRMTMDQDTRPPKMRKPWMHREIEGMKEAVAGDQKVALELEEHPGMVGLGTRLEKGLVGSDQSGLLFFCSQFALGLMQIVVVDEQHLMPPPPFVPSTASSSTVSSAVVAPSISSLTRFADLSLRSPAITSLLSDSPVRATQLHPPRETSSPTPERVIVQVQGNGEASPSAAENGLYTPAFGSKRRLWA